MACNNYVKNGPYSSERFSSRAEYEPGIGVTRNLRLDFSPGVSGTPAVNATHISVAPLHLPYNSEHTSHNGHPFMNMMDEISYWIYTKRAPCLMNYDNKIKNQSEEIQSSKTKPKSVPSIAKVPSPKKKKKRKLSLLDDNSSSTTKQRHVYFDSSQNVKPTVINNCKLDSLGSDIDFNLKTFSAPGKRKKLQKNSKTTVNKKTKIITSTPKVLPLRRSLRKAQQNVNKNSQLESSFEVCNASVTNGHNEQAIVEKKLPDKTKKTSQLLATGDQSVSNKKKATASIGQPKNNVLNGQFEDFSDVSGFTANYIRSTKLQSTKATRKSRLKNNRSLVKESQNDEEGCTANVLNANKSTNTTHKSQNCSTDSENVINLGSTRVDDKAAEASKSASLLQFMETKVDNEIGGTKTKKGLNVSFESKNKTSRYPKRHRNCSKTQESEIQGRHKSNNREKGKKINNNSEEINSSNKKQIPETPVVSKTRSGRSIGVSVCRPENSVVVLSNSTEQVSSTVSMNVASPVVDRKEKKKQRITRHSRSLKKQHVNTQRDSIREKSGFSACFSDSDDDSEPLKPCKYFRA